MADEVKVQPTDTKVETPAPEKPVEQKLESVQESKPATQSTETVPLPKYMEEKKLRKQLEDRVTELETSGGKPTAADLKELADKYEASPQLLAELDKRWGKGASKETSPATDPRITAIEHELAQGKRDKIFDGLWDKALEIAPEFKDVADKSSIKILAGLTENKDLTMTQLLEKVYQNVPQGKRTIESGKNGGREKNSDVNFKEMGDEDWNAIKNDPTSKAKYDEHLLESVKNLF